MARLDLRSFMSGGSARPPSMQFAHNNMKPGKSKPHQPCADGATASGVVVGASGRGVPALNR